MKFKIKPFHKNSYPLGGLLIKHPSIQYWMQEIQALGVPLHTFDIYPIPGMQPNSVWGCLLIFHTELNTSLAGKHHACQRVCKHLLIPEKSIYYPAIKKVELDKIFGEFPHIIHPDFGLVELKETLSITDMLTFPEEVSSFITQPKTPVFIPHQIKSFQVAPIPPEEVLKNLEEKVFPKEEKLEDKPLSMLEKGKLSFYKLLFNTKEDVNTKDNTETRIEKTGITKFIQRVTSGFSTKENNWTNKLQENFEDLEQRNRKQIDKLLDMLKNNPEEGLKYAIPLDDQGTGRGGTTGAFNLSKRWFDFSLSGTTRGSTSGSGGIDLGNDFNTLQSQYHSTARDLIKKGAYHKASFIYMRLLKNYMLAAETLEAGDYFQEAASIYYIQANNKRKAAECYEKAHMIENAIDIYEELGENEKVGDLYLDINNRKKATVFFQKVVEEYQLKDQFLKSSIVLRHKIQDPVAAQNSLLEGWRKNKDAFNCLNNYFSNIGDEKLLKNEIEAIYKDEVTDTNITSFLQVIQYEYRRDTKNATRIREIGYELIAKQLATNPSIVSELKVFNPKDKELLKDMIRFKSGRKKEK
ncbi:hypothetical protein GCM10022393_36620 [Aquimarina addita]|uniref:MoxR-vWA-beta-propeller ternary system domain-containing protein n=1 Tax=Aquimarina addita TaxID=870485 RepID=A0ABP6UR74_9FLAO